MLKPEQVKRLRDINVELLETLIHTLSSITDYSKRYDVPLPTEDKIRVLIQRAINLISEMNEEITIPSNLQLRIFKSRKLPPFIFDDENPDKLPES